MNLVIPISFQSNLKVKTDVVGATTPTLRPMWERGKTYLKNTTPIAQTWQTRATHCRRWADKGESEYAENETALN